MKEQELERVFLPRALPQDLFESRHRTIDDLYIPATEAHPIVRIRAVEGKYEITKKVTSPTDDSVRTEETIPLSESEYQALMQVPGKRLIKTRYYYERDGRQYEFGVYSGDLQGLVLIDVEFATPEEVTQFQPPDFLGQEVSHEKYLRGGELAGKKYTDIEENLKKLNYQKFA